MTTANEQMTAEQWNARQGTPTPAKAPAKRGRGRAVAGAKKEMNKTEKAYAYHLESLRLAGVIAWWSFEFITLKLAHDTRLTVDFAVQLMDGEIVLDETKGHMEDDAWVKLKVAARVGPFRIRLVRKKGTGWEYEEVKP